MTEVVSAELASERQAVRCGLPLRGCRRIRRRDSSCNQVQELTDVLAKTKSILDMAGMLQAPKGKRVSIEEMNPWR